MINEEPREWGDTYRDEESGQLSKWFPVHEGQQAVLQATSRFTLCLAGTGGGKTAVVPLWLMNEIAKKPQGRFLVVSPNYKMLRGSVLHEIQKSFKDCVPGRYKEGESVWECKSGALIYCFSADNPDSIQGIHADACVLDEAGLMNSSIWEIARQRTNHSKGRILLTTTPYANSGRWIQNNIYKPWQAGDDRITVVNFSSLANPTYSKEEYEYEKKTLPAWRFRMKYLGEYCKSDSAVFPHMDHCLISAKEFPKPDGVLVGAIDFGFIDPMATLIGFVNEGVLFVGFEKYQRRKTLTEYCVDLPKEPIYFADSARPDNIRDMRGYGFRVKAATKAAGSIIAGIDRINSLIRTGRLKICREYVPALLQECEIFSYLSNSEGEQIEQTEQDHNHAIDALRYLVAGAYRMRLLREGGSDVETSGG